MKLLKIHNRIPERYQLTEVCKRGDDSFCCSSSNKFMENVPTIAGWSSAFNGTLFKMNESVAPHTDDYVGLVSMTPKVRRAIFWNMTERESISFFSEDNKFIMEYGDWIVFDDSLEHALEANTTWYGAAWQLYPQKESDRNVLGFEEIYSLGS